MKTKSKLWILVSSFALCFSIMAFGIYAINALSLNVSGNLGFNMHDAVVDIDGVISPVVQRDLSGAILSNTKKIRLALGKDDSKASLDIGGFEFYSNENMIFDFSFKNLSLKPITMTITIDFGGNLNNLSIVEDTNYISFENNVYENFILADDTKQVKFALSLQNTTQLNQNNFNINFSFAEVQGITLTNGTYEGIKYTLDNTTPIETTGTNQTIYIASVSGYDSAAITNYPNAKIQPFITDGTNLYMVTSIGDYALQDCTSITSVKIPDSVTVIGGVAFSGCESLTSLTIGDGVTNIGGSAFQNCSNLNTLTIGNSVTSIGDWAFLNCSGLTGSLTIPDGVKSIGVQAFSGCLGLNSVSIGNSVTSIKIAAFESCSGLTSVTFESTNPPTFESNVFYNCNGNLIIYVPVGCVDAYSSNVTPSSVSEKVQEKA